MPDLAELTLIVNSAQVERATQSLESFGKVALQMVGVAAGLRIAFQAVATDASLDRAQQGFYTLMKSADDANRMIEELRVNSSQTGFKLLGLEDTAKELESFGVQGKEVIDIIKMAQDVARTQGGGDTQMAQMARTLAFLKGDAEQASRAVIQLRMSGVNAVEAIANELNITPEAALDRLQKRTIDSGTIFKAVADLVHDKFGGAVARDVNTLGGQWDILQAKLVLSREAVGKFIQTGAGLTGVIRTFNAALTPGTAEAQNLMTALKGVALVLEIIVSEKIIGGLQLAWVHIAAIARFLGQSVTAASPLLVLALAIGAAFAGWTIGQTLYDRFKQVALWAENIRFNIQQTMRLYDPDTIKVMFANVTGGSVDKNLAQRITRQFADDTTNHLNTIKDINAEWDAGMGDHNQGTKSFGEDMLGHMGQTINSLFDAQKAALKELFNTSEVTKEMDKAVQATDKEKEAVEQLNAARGTTIDELTREVQMQALAASQSQTMLDIQKKMAQAANAGDMQKLSKSDPAAYAAKMGAYQDALTQLYRSRMEASVEDKLSDIQYEDELLGKFGDEAEVLKELDSLYKQMRKEGIDADANQLAGAKQIITQHVQLTKLAGYVSDAAKGVGDAFGNAFDKAIEGATKFSDILKSLITDIEKSIIQGMVTKPLANGITNLFGNFMSSIIPGLGGTPSAPVSTVTHAGGGIVSSPTFFNMGGQQHVMGEAGDEGILPLTRIGGKLGVQSNGGGKNITVNINVSTPDADSFKKSRRQIADSIKRSMS